MHLENRDRNMGFLEMPLIQKPLKLSQLVTSAHL